MERLKPNILAVSWAMPPLLLPRALQISRLLEQWASQGWQTRVLTVSPASLKKSVLLDKDLEVLYGNNYTLIPLDSPERSLSLRLVFKLFPFLKDLPDEKRLWANKAFRKGLELHQQTPASVLISFAQPWSSHVAGLRLHQATGLPWIAHFSDPWTAGSHSQLAGWTAYQAKRWEARVIHAATRLVFVNQQTADATLAKYPDALKAKVRIVPHGFDRGTLQGLKQNAPKPGRPLTLAHSGNFYGTRTPWDFLQALSELHRTHPLTQRLQVIFVGHVPAEFLKKAKQWGVGGIVKALGPKPYLEALQTLHDADVLLLIEAASSHDNLYFPSKLVDYFLFQKPIFGLTPSRGASATLLSQLQCPAVEPDDVPGIQKALKTMLEQKEAGTLRVSEKFNEIIQAYDIQDTAAAFQAVVEEVLKN